MNPHSVEPMRYENHIGGADVPSHSGTIFSSINPTTGREDGSFAQSTAKDVDYAVNVAHKAFHEGPWSRLSPTQRGRLMMRWGDRIADSAEKIARLETRQNGKLLAEMHAQAKAAPNWLYYYGGLCDKIEGAVIPLERSSVLNYTLREPLGVIGVIVPWNSPTFLTIMSVAPALAAGNVIVLKPSEVTSASAIELARLAEDAGFPPGVINVVTGGREAGEALVDHELVAKIVFTGGDAGGRQIAQAAGKRLAACTLELGGKNANIVFDDADLEQAEAGVLAGIFAAAGQTCVAGSRTYVHESIYETFAQRLVARAKQIRVGDPMLAEVQMGPAATLQQLEKNESMVTRARSEGAEILCGGHRLEVPQAPGGYFFSPTILHKADSSSSIMNNEVFGPVLALTPFRSESEVAHLANSSRYGLAAGVWTLNLRRAHTMARRLQAGTVWINTYRALAFNSPFGGYKESGLGRQNGLEAVLQYLQTKSVWCELSDEAQDPFVLKT
jgi:aldehyde dehydrogenase (NAD+)